MKPKIGIFYGGDAATLPRAELLAWLRGPDMGIDARLVSEAAPHSQGAVDSRVDDLIEWADAAIAIMTPDERGKHCAPNVMDEIGRWSGRKGKRSLMRVVQKGVEQYSNHNGLVYSEFDTRIKEAFEAVRRFITDVTKTPQDTPTAQTMPAPKALTVNESGELILVGDAHFRCQSIFESGIDIQVIAENPGPAIERLVANLGSKVVAVAFADRAAWATVHSPNVQRRAGIATLTFTLRVDRGRHESPMELNLGGADPMTADEAAQFRASRILTGLPAAFRDSTKEMLVKGFQSWTIDGPTLARFASYMPSSDTEAWRLVRLTMVRDLVLSGAVEFVDHLRLTVSDGQLVKVDFRGVREKKYANVAAPIVACVADIK